MKTSPTFEAEFDFDCARTVLNQARKNLLDLLQRNEAQIADHHFQITKLENLNLIVKKELAVHERAITSIEGQPSAENRVLP